MLTKDTRTGASSLSLFIAWPLLSQSCSGALSVAWAGPGALITQTHHTLSLRCDDSHLSPDSAPWPCSRRQKIFYILKISTAWCKASSRSFFLCSLSSVKVRFYVLSKKKEESKEERFHAQIYCEYRREIVNKNTRMMVRKVSYNTDNNTSYRW